MPSFEKRQAVPPTESHATLHCDRCGQLQGYVLPGRLVLLTGQAVRFPFKIVCQCGLNIPWKENGNHTESRTPEDLTAKNPMI